MSTFIALGSLTFLRLFALPASASLESLLCSHHLTPVSTPLILPAVPTVLATGEPICRSTNSAPYLKRGEYDLDEE